MRKISFSDEKLFAIAKHAGVTKFGLFNDAGYKGLYGMPLSDIELRKGIKKENYWIRPALPN